MQGRPSLGNKVNIFFYLGVEIVFSRADEVADSFAISLSNRLVQLTRVARLVAHDPPAAYKTHIRDNFANLPSVHDK